MSTFCNGKVYNFYTTYASKYHPECYTCRRFLRGATDTAYLYVMKTPEFSVSCPSVDKLSTEDLASETWPVDRV